MKVDFVDWVFRFSVGLTLLVAGAIALYDSGCLSTQCKYNEMKKSSVTIYGGNNSQCSGTYIKDHYILTAAHCATGDIYEKVSVVTSAGLFNGEYVGLIPSLDLALIHVPKYAGVSAVLGATKYMEAGDTLYSVTTPVGLIDSLGQGTLSHAPRYNYHSRRLELQYAAPQFFGSSGGGVYNSHHELVGVISYFRAFPYFMFAIAIDQAKDGIDQLIVDHKIYMLLHPKEVTNDKR